MLILRSTDSFRLVGFRVSKESCEFFNFSHNGLLDSYFFQATSISPSGFPWMSGNQGASSELNFRDSGCDHEVLGVLESKN